MSWPAPPQGGAEAFFERLVLAQHRAGMEVLAVIRRDAGRAARLTEGGLPPAQLRFGGPLDWLTAPRLGRELKRFRPQVVVAWMSRAAGFARAASGRQPPWAMAGRLGGAYPLRHYSACDLLAANTQGLCDWIAAQGWPADRVRKVPNFAADLLGAPPATLPFAPGAIPLLAMGRLHPNKDFSTLLRAMALLPGQVHLALAGDGPERIMLETLAGELGLGRRVAFLGWRQDVGGAAGSQPHAGGAVADRTLGECRAGRFFREPPCRRRHGRWAARGHQAGGERDAGAHRRCPGARRRHHHPARPSRAHRCHRRRRPRRLPRRTCGSRRAGRLGTLPGGSRPAPRRNRLMCGIAGLALRQGLTPDPAILKAMLGALAHRGPDGEGVHIADNVGLIHNRLAIIDLATGDQPLFAGPATLIANGEVYNYIELRQAHALVCATGSDCEPPLHLYRRDGAEATALAMRGMYAMALHDRATRRLVLTRDPFGIKPMYLAEVEGGIAFASEPQALIAAGLVQPVVRAEARDELLQSQFTTGAETIFAGISRILPGETVVIADGAIVERHRRAALPEGGPVPMTEEEALSRLDAAFEDSVRLHQRSDVPYGLFLSGGIDSGAVLAMMARLNSQPVRAFTASFDVPGAADERAAAEAAAKAHGALHTTITVTEAEVWRELPKIVAAMDDPAADYAIIPTWFLARRARQDVKVVLSGEGGDELFGGYGRYRSAMRPLVALGPPAARHGRLRPCAACAAGDAARLAGRHHGGGGRDRPARPQPASGGAGRGHRRLAAE
jgi:asparagine synthase (glutamine-hydrolysing)